MSSITLFKFAALTSTKEIVKNKSLKFTNPKNFNDPFDCVSDRLRFDISDVGTDVEKDLLTLKQMFGSNLAGIPEKKLEVFYQDSIKHKISQTVACCFALIHDNPLMWSHYADKHKGACLMFEFNKKSPFPEIETNLLTFGAINYDEPPPLNYLKDKEGGIFSLFLNKSRHWKYEQEFRILSFQKEDYYRFSGSFLVGIIFGLQCARQEIVEIQALCIESGFNKLRYVQAYRNGLQLEFNNLTPKMHNKSYYT